jgi:hypothetical protein
MRNKQQQQPVPQRPAAGIRASRSDVGEPHDDESPFASQQQHAWAGSAGGGASCASPTTPPLNASTSFGRRLTRFLPSWGSSSGGGSSFKSVASFGRSRGVGGSARSSAEAVVSADAADAAAVGAAARDPLASMEATGQGPMTSFRRRLTSTSSDAGQDAAPSTPPAPQAAPMAMLAQERPQRRSLSPITESPTPKSPRPQDQAVAAASRARARSSSYSPGPQVVVLTGPGEVDVLHTGYSSDDEDGPAGAMQPSERQVRMRAVGMWHCGKAAWRPTNAKRQPRAGEALSCTAVCNANAMTSSTLGVAAVWQHMTHPAPPGLRRCACCWPTRPRRPKRTRPPWWLPWRPRQPRRGPRWPACMAAWPQRVPAARLPRMPRQQAAVPAPAAAAPHQQRGAAAEAGGCTRKCRRRWARPAPQSLPPPTSA